MTCVINENTLCGSLGASGKSWAWLNANRKQPAHYKGILPASRHLIQTAAVQQNCQLMVQCLTATAQQRCFECLVRENPSKHCQYADLNSDSMKLWGQYPDLAVFPGTVLLSDDRPGDPDYPSSSLTQAQLSAEEPALSGDACQAGARLYPQEGAHPLCLIYKHA